MYNESSISLKEITPKLAQDLIDKSPYEYQRKLRDWHVDELALAMTSGRFLTNTITLCENGNNVRYLVNGQHTLQAIIKSGVTLKLPVQIIHANNQSDLAKIYTRLDRGVRRTKTDTLRAYNLNEKLKLGRIDLERYASVARLILCNFNSNLTSVVPDEDMINFMSKWLDAARSYLDCLAESPIHIVMQRRDVFSIGLITFKYLPDIAGEFWKPVALDDGLSLSDPRKTLNRWLVSVRLSGGEGGRKRTVNASEAIRSVALAWSAWKEKKELKLIRVMNTTMPVRIAGTPYGEK